MNDSTTVRYNPNSPTNVYATPPAPLMMPKREFAPPPPPPPVYRVSLPPRPYEPPPGLIVAPAFPPKRTFLPRLTPFWLTSIWGTAILLLGVKMGVPEVGVAASTVYLLLAVWRGWV